MLPPTFLLSKFILYIFQNIVYIKQNLFIAKTDNTEAYLFKMCSPHFIIFLLFAFRMVCAINLYYQHSIETNKINNIIVDDVLSPEVFP